MFIWIILLKFLSFVSSIDKCLDIRVDNDNFCDCTDGRDELMTSACSNLISSSSLSSSSKNRYICQGSINFLLVTIPQSRIGDGICDCCDGADEIDSNFDISCPNQCNEIFNDIKLQSTNISNGVSMLYNYLYLTTET